MEKTGKLSLNLKGRGSVRFPDIDGKKQKDIYIPVDYIGNAFHGDMVKIQVFPKPNKWGDIEAKIISIEERVNNNFIAVVEDFDNKFIYAFPDNTKLYCKFKLFINEKIKVNKNDKVLLKIDFNAKQDDYRIFTGEILKNLGQQGVHETEILSILASSGFETEHKQEIIDEAEKSAKDHGNIENDLINRLDYRDVWTCTIDPIDAKDFDDALSFRKIDTNIFELGVHIADVSHFVRLGTDLDKEAYKRSFSVYLVDRTIPMLPEILSNGMCSLNPGVDRFAFSAIFIVDKNANILEKKFAKTIIHSNKRFHYEEAQEVLDKADKTLYPELFELDYFAHIFAKNRKNQGAIDFESDEIKFKLDNDGKPIAVYKRDRSWTHHLIEEYMLLANKEVAKYIYDHNLSKKLNGVYRVHDLPDKDRIDDLAIFVNALGLDWKPGAKIHASDVQKLLEKTNGLPSEAIIKTSTLRSMAKAAYKTVNIGHFGLAFPFYTHFTSPIRRYPDLCVHRLLQMILIHKIDMNFINSLNTVCDHASNQEIKSVEAERASIRYKQVEFMLSKLGQVIDCTISSVAEFGFFVQDNESLAEGLIRVRDMIDDIYEINMQNYTVTGVKNNKKFTLGDKVKALVKSVDVNNRSIEFVIVQ